jgi:hypothetical protein
MNLKNAENYILFKEAVDMLPPSEPKRRLGEALESVSTEPDEIIERTLKAIQITLGEEFGVVVL